MVDEAPLLSATKMIDGESVVVGKTRIPLDDVLGASAGDGFVTVSSCARPKASWFSRGGGPRVVFFFFCLGVVRVLVFAVRRLRLLCICVC